MEQELRLTQEQIDAYLNARTADGLPAGTATNYRRKLQLLYELLPDTAKRWTDRGILRVNGVTSLFPCVHFFFLMTEFAVAHGLSGTVTELELEPLLYRAGAVLEESRQIIEEKLKSEHRTLPCLLTIPDMFDFITEYAGGERIGSESLAAELAGALTSGLACDLYKLSLG